MPERKIDTTQNKVYVRALDTYEYNRVSAVLFPLLDALLADNAIQKNALCGKKVVLKPNLVAKREAEAGITTHPSFIRACAVYFQECGASVTIADSPGGVYTVSALDGGKVFFLVINTLALAIFKRQIPPKYENYIHMAGFALLMALMLFITFHDVMKLL